MQVEQDSPINLGGVHTPRSSMLALKDWRSGQSWTYAQLDQYADSCGLVLMNQYSIQSGDRIAVCAPFSMEYIALAIAASKVGFVIVPMNYRLTTFEISNIYQTAQCKLVLYTEEWTSICSGLGGVPLSWQVWKKEVMKMKEKNELLPRNLISEEVPWFLFYTSGSTGEPKGVIYNYRMSYWNGINTRERLQITANDKTCLFMPPFHTGGWNVLGIPLLQQGGCVVILDKFDAGTALEILEKEKITIFMAVPTMLQMMVHHVDFIKKDLKSIRCVITGGEAIAKPVLDAWLDRNIPLRPGYGLTEAGPNLTSLSQEKTHIKPSSIGSPNPFVLTRIQNEDGEEVPKGAPGELLVQGPTVTPGYWNGDPGSWISALDQHGWLHTGDLVIEDEEGDLFLIDRIKNMYVSGGENVYPSEIEKVLVTYPGIENCCVIPIPNSKWGQSGKACIIWSQSNPFSILDCQEFLRKHLAAYKIPKEFLVVSEFPLLSNGKINRLKIKELYA